MRTFGVLINLDIRMPSIGWPVGGYTTSDYDVSPEGPKRDVVEGVVQSHPNRNNGGSPTHGFNSISLYPKHYEHNR